MQIPHKRSLAIATVAILAIYCTVQVVPQLGKSLAFADSNVANSNHHHHHRHHHRPAEVGEATTALGEATTSAKSFVDDVRVNGIDIKSPDTLSLTLAQFKDNDQDDSQNVDNITIVATAMSFDNGENQVVSLIGDATLNGGWSGTQSVDIKLAGSGSLENATLITAEVMPEMK